jgi:reductive dehalogenase
MAKLRSYANRAAQLGPYPLEDLRRTDQQPDWHKFAPFEPVSFINPAAPLSIVNAMGEYQAMMDAIRDGAVKAEQADIPEDPIERAAHLKAFGYYCDASMVGICKIPMAARLASPIQNPDVLRLAQRLQNGQSKSAASGVEFVQAAIKRAMKAPLAPCDQHNHALVFLYEYPRDPAAKEPGTDWLHNAQAQRAALRGAETASVLASYLRSLGYSARAHSGSASDVHLPMLAVAAGLALLQESTVTNPLFGTRFGLSVVTTNMEMAPDQPLADLTVPVVSYKLGLGKNARNRHNHDPFAKRLFVNGPHPFETLKRVEKTTNYLDEDNIARVPKRSDMFARSLFGDLGPKVQEAAKNGNYVRKTASAYAFRYALAAFVPLQEGPIAPKIAPSANDAARNAANIKATAYFLGCDAVGLSRCPDWCYYSHDPNGEELTPYHKNAISIVIDQGHETMEGASGDDWIACAQSMRAYLRFSLLGGVLAQQIRNMGYSARVHTVMGSDVLQPPLTLLAGLGEVSRIGDVILNPFLGPRLKSGTVTTNMPMTHDKPIDFGLQSFCDSCNKCARECPSGAITAGPKRMFNGYEIWKPDSQKCTNYRITNEGGAMCGRCMKTCPWNLEGLFKEAPFRWVGMNFPKAAKWLTRLDDALNNGTINPQKKWWWDLEMRDEGPYQAPQKPVNKRQLHKDLVLKHSEQTLAAYTANLLPPPYPWPYPMDRDAAIDAYEQMISAKEYKARRAKGIPPEHRYEIDTATSIPVMRLRLNQVEKLSPKVTKYSFVHPEGANLPAFTAGAHLDVVVAPEFLRPYSLCSDPADRRKYEIAVLREDQGRGGSSLLHSIFEPGRMVFAGAPVNHFPLHDPTGKTYLMGGGIGVTPMIAMAHELAAKGADFELHYSASRTEDAAFDALLKTMPWAAKVSCHYSDQGNRANLVKILKYQKGSHVFTCGPETYMAAVLSAAEANGFDGESRHMEYFDAPETPEYENHAFTLRLTRSGRDLTVSADQSATDVLTRAGIPVSVKCANGICGVCQCALVSGTVEHRDFVLSSKQRKTTVILCQSRAAEPDGVMEIDL